MKALQGILRFLFYIIVGVVICIVGAAFFFMNWEPNRHQYALRGIDVSHHKGEIDWPKVANDDVAFAYIKASEGGDLKDKHFVRNWDAAGAAGLARGAYHFFSLCKDGESQAKNFLSVLPQDSAMLALAVDLEFEGNCARRPPVDEVLHEIAAFVTLVEQATARSVILYVPEDFYLAYLKGRGLNRRLWARSIWHSPDYAQDWVLWQYHHSGTVKGIEGGADLNVVAAEKTLDDLRR